jgi:hypothetical protein
MVSTCHWRRFYSRSLLGTGQQTRQTNASEGVVGKGGDGHKPEEARPTLLSGCLWTGLVEQRK